MSSALSGATGVTGFIHVGLVVDDLDEMLRFLTVLGFECSEPGIYGGNWIDRIVGLDSTEIELAMVRLPDGPDVMEVVRFRSPFVPAQEASPGANRPGLRHISFSVEDMHGVVERVRAAGWEPIREVVNYQDTYLLTYIRGPEGVIVELAQKIGEDRR
jgi:catechol 2,3-dioxygenase-like lactoylglutathione lyase family enzyme